MLADRPGWAAPLVAAAGLADEDIPAALQLAARYGRQLPLPGGGQTAGRWAVLAAVARQNLTAARVLEAHSDALAILAEAGQPAPGGTWGVFAAETAQHRLAAAPGRGPGQVVLTGVKPWCSLAGQLDSALVTAHAGPDRQLFRVSLRHPSVTVDPPGAWVARGLRTVTSQPVRFDATPATAVGGPGWYLTRPGFAWGAIGVAACWHGGARGLQDALLRAMAGRDGELAALHAGIVDTALYAAEAALASAARDLDAGRASGRDGDILALRVRAVVAGAAERAIRQVGHALGPAPLAFDEEHARRVADLELYVRQHHAERDLARLGAAITARGQDAGVIRHVAVIVPAADEEERIGRCLASIATAARHLARREAGIGVRVVVTLDSCRDATAAVCAAFPGVSTVAITSRNVGAARRAGTRAVLAARAGPARELWLASTDADSAVPADWLTAMVAAAARGVHLVLGTVLPGPDLSPAVRARWLARHHLRDGHPHVHGANLGIRADAYLALGGWLPLVTGEDADLARRAAAAGWLAISRSAGIPVVTSARRAGRAPRGFSSYLRALADRTERAGPQLASTGTRPPGSGG